MVIQLAVYLQLIRIVLINTDQFVSLKLEHLKFPVYLLYRFSDLVGFISFRTYNPKKATLKGQWVIPVRS